jgi:NAD(P)-dependent dehydrogenase (short-subunit alcohol dehydrogenase family)
MRDRALSGTAGLITGAGRGIGRVVAERLAAVGMTVGLVARSETELRATAAAVAAAGGRAEVLPTDVTDSDAVAAAVDRFHAAAGRLDLVINNAGRLAAVGPLWQTDPATWRRDVEINVAGVYLGCRHALPPMLAAGRGRIVNMVGGGVTGPFPYVSAYAASKAAVMRLTENLAAELDREGAPVRVFALTPGLNRTAMTEQFIGTEAGRRWMSYMVELFGTATETTPDRAAAVVVAIAAGRLDAYHGRFLSAPQDAPRLDRLAADGSELGPNARTMGIVEDAP